MTSHRIVAADERPGETAEQTGTSSPVLTVTDVSKSYATRKGDPVAALGSVTTSVGQGEFVSFLGPSGCGKTTLMKICAGLVPATAGTVSYLGAPGPVPQGKFGIVLQTPALLPWRTVLRNVLLPAEILGRAKSGRFAERARELLALVHLDGSGDRYPQELSGGMQQRAAIARSLITDPDVLFMDEPFGALDAITRQELNAGLQEIHIRERKTVFFITHSVQEAVFLSDRIVVMSDRPGTIIEDVRVPLPRPRVFADVVRSDTCRELESLIHTRLSQ